MATPNSFADKTGSVLLKDLDENFEYIDDQLDLKANSESPTLTGTVSLTGKLNLPSYTEAERDAASWNEGDTIYNSTSGKMQVWNGLHWLSAGDGPPEFTSAAGLLGEVYDSERESTSFSVSATDLENTPITYAIQSGSLPAGVSLNTSTGAITGTFNAVTTDTTSTFTIRATDGLYNYTDRQFSIIVKAPIVLATYTTTDTVHTWSKPSGVTKIKAAIWGAGGGGGNPGGQGGAGGGYTIGTIDVSSISTLSVVVGEGGNGENDHFNSGNGNGCGGGLSGIFTLFDSDRTATYGRSVLVAGGGGGGGNNGDYPGTGGGSSGVAGAGGAGGTPGTQTAGGTLPNNGSGSCTSNCVGQELRGANGCGGAEFDSGGSFPSTYWGGVWSMGAGGNGCNAGGGGGGYWGGGGGGGTPNGGPGGGGSGYIGGHASAPVSNATTSSNGNQAAPAGTTQQYYAGTAGYGASAAELNGNDGLIVIWR